MRSETKFNICAKDMPTLAANCIRNHFKLQDDNRKWSHTLENPNKFAEGRDDGALKFLFKAAQFMAFRILARIGIERVASLVWEGEALVDWLSGGNRFGLDGRIVPRQVNYAYRFDAACGSPSGNYAVIYERRGTKGVILKQGQILREINRSFYCANAYEFPVCIAPLGSGQEVLIHCPDAYNRLEIDDVETGERLTKCENREPCDFFHSRLAVSPSGSHFLSAGWIWAPVDALGVFSLAEAIRNPKSLDRLVPGPPQSSEISAAAFLNGRFVVISTSEETFLDDEDFEEDPNLIRPSRIAIWDLAQSRTISQRPLSELTGTLMAVDPQFVVGFYEHPKLIDLQTGRVVARLEDVASGKQTSSITHHVENVPPLALDPERRRFAIATPREILVVEIQV